MVNENDQPYRSLAGDLPATLSGFDIPAALDRLNGKKELLYRLLIRFDELYGAVSSDLTALLGEGRMKEAQRLAHTLKGGAAALEATEIAECARHIEHALAKQETEQMPELIANLEMVIRPAINEIELFSKRA